MAKTNNLDPTWTLFLDRDGVINKEIRGSYVTRWEDFDFEEKAPEAIKLAAKLFGRIIIVTNQRGVGRGIMSMEDLRLIHTKMIACIESVGGRIDKVYSATAIDDDNHNRKPNIGMGMQAQQDFSEVDFQKSIMVGNNQSDMEFGKRLGMHTVFIKSTIKEPTQNQLSWIDESHNSLYSWAQSLKPAALVV